MSRTRNKLHETMVNLFKDSVAHRKLEPEQGTELQAILAEIFHAEAVKNAAALDKALHRLCTVLLK